MPGFNEAPACLPGNDGVGEKVVVDLSTLQ